MSAVTPSYDAIRTLVATYEPTLLPDLDHLLAPPSVSPGTATFLLGLISRGAIELSDPDFDAVVVSVQTARAELQAVIAGPQPEPVAPPAEAAPDPSLEP